MHGAAPYHGCRVGSTKNKGNGRRRWVGSAGCEPALSAISGPVQRQPQSGCADRTCPPFWPPSLRRSESRGGGRPSYSLGRPAFRKFCRLELGGEVPDATTPGRFRTRLVEQDLWELLCWGMMRRCMRTRLTVRRKHARSWMVAAALADRPARMIDYQPLYRSPPNLGCAMGFAVWEG